MKQTFLILFTALLVGAAHSEEQPWHQGVWQTQGYGYIFSIQNNLVNVFEKTSISCLTSGLSAEKLTIPKPDAVPYFNVGIPGFINAKMELYKHKEPNKILFHRNDTNTHMLAKKLGKLPDICSQPSNDKQTFNVFLQNFREHYPFNSRYPEFIKMEHPGSEQLNDSALFDEMSDILNQLNDPHTALIAPNVERAFFGNELPNPKIPSEQELKRINQRIHNHYLVGSVVKLNDKINMGELPDRISYLSISGFWGLSKENNETSEKMAMESAIAKILTRLKDSAGLIIDLRTHSGGSDKLGSQLASAFTDRDYVAYRKQFVLKGGLDPVWAEGAPISVNGRGSKAWLGQIILLTGSATVSAGEAFIMALNERQPKVITIGSRTRGSFSDMLPRTLPNGWLFALPNERYLNKNGESFDFVGLPPDKIIPDDFQHDNQDPVLDAAIRLLKK